MLVSVSTAAALVVFTAWLANVTEVGESAAAGPGTKPESATVSVELRLFNELV